MAQSEMDAVVEEIEQALGRLQPRAYSVMEAVLVIYRHAVWNAMAQSDVQHWPSVVNKVDRQLQELQSTVRQLIEPTLAKRLRDEVERSVAN
jgi:hypothetical protein